MYKQDEIKDWAKAKGIYDDPNFVAQMKGVAEEAVEATEAYILSEYQEPEGFFVRQEVWEAATEEERNQIEQKMIEEEKRLIREDLAKELGDIYVWWINACEVAGVEPEVAIDAAVEKIIKRTGKMENGRFVKDD